MTLELELSLILLFVFLVFQCTVKAQKRIVADTLTLEELQAMGEIKKEPTNSFPLQYLYISYRDNLVYKNVPYKGLSFELERLAHEHSVLQEATFGQGRSPQSQNHIINKSVKNNF